MRGEEKREKERGRTYVLENKKQSKKKRISKEIERKGQQKK